MNRLAAMLAPLALAGAVSACAYDPNTGALAGANPVYVNPPPTPANPYPGFNPPPAYGTPAPGYVTAPYVTPAPVAQPYAPGYAPVATVRPDPTGYCREAYANYVDAQNRAAYTGNPVDVGRAQNTASFYRRDCG